MSDDAKTIDWTKTGEPDSKVVTITMPEWTAKCVNQLLHAHGEKLKANALEAGDDFNWWHLDRLWDVLDEAADAKTTPSGSITVGNGPPRR